MVSVPTIWIFLSGAIYAVTGRRNMNILLMFHGWHINKYDMNILRMRFAKIFKVEICN